MRVRVRTLGAGLLATAAAASGCVLTGAPLAAAVPAAPATS